MSPSVRRALRRAAARVTARRSSLPALVLLAAGCGEIVRVEAPDGTLRLAVSVERAESEDARRRGLRGRPPLAADEGLLLVFPPGFEGEVCLDNVGVTFAVDAVYAAADGEVVAVRTLPAETPGPFCEPRTSRVLEVGGGRAAPVRPGDRLR